MGAKVAWSSICYPLKEGGLGLKSLKTWNRAATMKHIWCILTDKHSIWATWVHTTLLRGRSFWQLNIPSNPSWSWRKVLQSRDWCRGKFTTCIGNGNTTYLWFDYWLPEGKRINDMLPLRTLTYKVTLKCKGLRDHQRGWLELSKQYPSLSSNLELYSFSARTHMQDRHVWKGNPSGQFTIDSAWELLRETRPANTIHHLLWFKGHIPRQSFILWLASQGRLRTIDRLHTVGSITNTACILCGMDIENHDH